MFKMSFFQRRDRPTDDAPPLVDGVVHNKQTMTHLLRH